MDDDAINFGTNSIVLDFVTYNGDHNNFIYSGFLFTSMAGGELKIDKFIMPLLLDLYVTPLDHFIAAIEILVVIGFFILLGDTIYKTWKDAWKYHRHECAIKNLLGVKQRKLRYLIKPEFLRKY